MLPKSEKAARFAAQLMEIRSDPLIGNPHVTRCQTTADVICKIRRTVVGSQGKQEPVSFIIGPVKIRSQSIGWDRILKTQSAGIALQHGLQKCPVHHIQFLLAFPIGELHLLSAHNGLLLRHVLRYHQIQGNMGKWCLRSPSARRIDAENKCLHAFFHPVIGKVVRLDKGRQIRIKRRK